MPDADSEQPLPPLVALRAFHAAARTERFSRAASELHISQSAVSHHIRKLEAYLNVRLFDRANATVRLTDAGARYFAEVHPALERIRAATADIRRQGRRRRVTLTTLASTANTWLIPNWSSFEACCPDVDLQLFAASRAVNLEREHVDLALRYGGGSWPGLTSRWLFAEQLIPVALPGHIPAKNAADPGAALAGSRLIVNETDPDEWSSWSRTLGLPRPDVRNALRFADGHQVLLAAQAGLGVAMGRRPVVDSYLRSRCLAAPFGAIELPDQGCYLCYPSGRELPPEVAQVAGWLERLVGEIAPVEELLKDVPG